MAHAILALWDESVPFTTLGDKVYRNRNDLKTQFGHIQTSDSVVIGKMDGEGLVVSVDSLRILNQTYGVDTVEFATPEEQVAQLNYIRSLPPPPPEPSAESDLDTLAIDMAMRIAKLEDQMNTEVQ